MENHCPRSEGSGRRGPAGVDVPSSIGDLSWRKRSLKALSTVGLWTQRSLALVACVVVVVVAHASCSIDDRKLSLRGAAGGIGVGGSVGSGGGPLVGTGGAASVGGALGSGGPVGAGAFGGGAGVGGTNGTGGAIRTGGADGTGGRSTIGGGSAGQGATAGNAGGAGHGGGAGGSDGTAGVGGMTGAGDATGNGGSGSGCPGVAIVPDGEGWVAAGTNSLGIHGSWFEYSDCADLGGTNCSTVTTPPPAGFPNMGGKMCTSGMTSTASSAWGAGIALEVNDGPPQMPYDTTAHGVKGFCFQLTGLMIPSTSIRVAFPTKLNNDNAYFSTVTTRGQHTVLFSDTAQGSWVTTKTAFEPTALMLVQFRIPSSTAAPVPWDFCIEGLTAITQ